MTKRSAIWTHIREYHLWAAPVAVGLPVAAAFLAVGSPSVRPPVAPGTLSKLASPARLPVMVDGPAASDSSGSAGQAGGSTPARDPLGLQSDRATPAQIDVAKAVERAHPVITPSAVPSSPRSAGHLHVVAAPSANGTLGLSLGHAGAGVTGSSPAGVSPTVQPRPAGLPGLQADGGTVYGVRTTTETQPVAGSSTPQPVQVWTATPNDTTAADSLTASLAAEGYNVSGIFSAALQPQLVSDYAAYIGEGLSPSYAYGADSVSASEVSVFQHLGFTLMKDLDTGNQFWVGPELALSPEFAPVTS